MANVSAKNGQCKIKGKMLDAGALLKSAAKSPGTSKASPFDYGNLPAASRVLLLTRQRDELDRELALAKDEVRAAVDPFYRDCLAKHGFESSVRVDAAKAGKLRVTFVHRYCKLAASVGEQIAQIAGAAYDRFFKTGATLKLRKEIADDPERLNDAVLALAEAIGPKRFQEFFECEQTLIPTRAFTERRYNELSAEQNVQLEALGVKQIVSMAEAK
jgi:hypothetical protein